LEVQTELSKPNPEIHQNQNKKNSYICHQCGARLERKRTLLYHLIESCPVSRAKYEVPVQCKKCAGEFRRTHPEQVYCADCLKCSFPGCGEPLRRRNQVGLCNDHRHVIRPKAHWRACKEPSCTRRVRSDSGSEFCKPHLSPSNRPSLARVCGECGVPLRITNTCGLCRKHSMNEHHRRGRLRIEQLLARAARSGRPKKTLETKAFTEVGRQVEVVLATFKKICSLWGSGNFKTVWQIPGFSKDHLSAARSSPHDPLVASRYFVAHAKRLSYETVRGYHQDYRKHMVKAGVAC
jgi:hypothetical protein